MTDNSSGVLIGPRDDPAARLPRFTGIELATLKTRVLSLVAPSREVDAEVARLLEFRFLSNGALALGGAPKWWRKFETWEGIPHFTSQCEHAINMAEIFLPRRSVVIARGASVEREDAVMFWGCTIGKDQSIEGEVVAATLHSLRAVAILAAVLEAFESIGDEDYGT